MCLQLNPTTQPEFTLACAHDLRHQSMQDELQRNPKFIVRESASKWQAKARESAHRDFDEDSDPDIAAVDPETLHPSFSVQDIKKRDKEIAREQHLDASVRVAPVSPAQTSAPTPPQSSATAINREKKRKEAEEADAAAAAAQAAARRAVSLAHMFVCLFERSVPPPRSCVAPLYIALMCDCNHDVCLTPFQMEIEEARLAEAEIERKM